VPARLFLRPPGLLRQRLAQSRPGAIRGQARVLGHGRRPRRRAASETPASTDNGTSPAYVTGPLVEQRQLPHRPDPRRDASTRSKPFAGAGENGNPTVGDSGKGGGGSALGHGGVGSNSSEGPLGERGADDGKFPLRAWGWARRARSTIFWQNKNTCRLRNLHGAGELVGKIWTTVCWGERRQWQKTVDKTDGCENVNLFAPRTTRSRAPGQSYTRSTPETASS